MKLSNLIAQNIGTFRYLEIDFSPIITAAITGKNGAGKSTIIDGILLALYGECSKGTMETALRRGESSGSVILDFIGGNGRKYHIEREYDLAKRKTRLKFHDITFVAYQDLSGKSPTETQKEILKVIKLDYRTFTNTSIILQGKSSSLSTMNDADRKEIVYQTLINDTFDRLAKKADAEHKILQTKMDELSTKLINAKQRIEQNESLIKQITAKTNILSTQEETERNITAEIDRLRADEIRLTARYESQKPILDEIGSLASQIGEHRRSNEKRQKQINALSREIEAAEKTIANKQAIEAAAQELATLETQLPALQASQEKYNALNSRHNETTAKRDAWQTNRATRLKNAQQQTAAAERQALGIEGIPCDQDLHERCPLYQQASQDQANITALKAAQQAITEEINPHEATIAANYRELQEILKTFTPETLKATQDRIKALQPLARQISALHAAEAEIVAKRTWLLQQSEEHLQTEQTIAGMETRKAWHEQSIDNAANEPAIDALKADLQERSSTLNTLRQQIGETRQDIGYYQAQKEALKIDKASNEIPYMEDKKELLQAEIDECKCLIALCSRKSGVPALIVENALPYIQANANRLLEDITGGTIQIRLDSTFETKTGKQKEGLPITICHNGDAAPYDTFSGAEKFLADYAFRLGLNEFQADRAGAKVDLCVLDEGLGALDDENRQAMIEAILSNKRFSNTLIITHLKEISDAMPARLIVTAGPDGSRVEVAA